MDKNKNLWGNSIYWFKGILFSKNTEILKKLQYDKRKAICHFERCILSEEFCLQNWFLGMLNSYYVDM